ncbi:MAG TPA: PPC domain-containing protein [Thermoguttaceae bacterium]|nr:PPC domain-containing protein [Thermoguttaceae bacterium]
MNRFRWHAILAVAALLAATSDLHAQRAPQDPHIGYVYPTGGQQNNYFEALVGGQNIKETSEVYISGSGVKAEIVKWYRPLTRGQYIGLGQKIRFTREDLEEEQKKKGKTERITNEMVYKKAGVTEDDLKEMEIYRKRDADPKRQSNDQIAEELTLKITIDANAEPGKREMRVITPDSMSNPIWFQVDRWEERYETEPNDEKPDPTVGSTLPVVVNGQIMPGDVDRFSFTARKGTRLVISADARELMPYLADAVPGWFQAVLALYDAEGNEVAYAGAYYYRQDPVIYYEVPEDGEYFVEIRDSIYRGREDFVYRITLGELPFVTGIFPLGARAGTEVDVELQGWNLVDTQLSVRAVVNRNRPVRWYSIPQNDKVSIRFPLRIDMASEVLDQEPNDGPETAQEVTLPVIVNGRIDKPDDRDVFKFDAHGTLVAEVYARRAGSPVDSALSLTDATGKEVGFNDDFWDKAEPLITHHADSRLSVVLSGQSPYCLHLSDAQRTGGEDFIYRLYIRPPLPDFVLRVVPSCIIARPGATVPITVHALRRDYDGDIQLSLVDPPAGFQLSGTVVPSDVEKMPLTLTVPPIAGSEPVLLEMDGQSVRGRGHSVKLSRPVVPAESMMQAFLWLQIVPAEQWAIVLSGKPVTKPPLEFPPVDRVELKLGETTILGARLTAKNVSTQDLRVDLSEPPDGVTVEKVSPEALGLAVVLATDAEKVKPGQRGNLIFEVFREYTPAPTEATPKPEPRRTSVGILPAVPFEVVGRPPKK